jgi:hypothetical protein
MFAGAGPARCVHVRVGRPRCVDARLWVLRRRRSGHAEQAPSAAEHAQGSTPWQAPSAGQGRISAPLQALDPLRLRLHAHCAPAEAGSCDGDARPGAGVARSPPCRTGEPLVSHAGTQHACATRVRLRADGSIYRSTRPQMHLSCMQGGACASLHARQREAGLVPPRACVGPPHGSITLLHSADAGTATARRGDRERGWCANKIRVRRTPAAPAPGRSVPSCTSRATAALPGSVPRCAHTAPRPELGPLVAAASRLDPAAAAAIRPCSRAHAPHLDSSASSAGAASRAGEAQDDR